MIKIDRIKKMKKIRFELYIDESGSFEDAASSDFHPKEASLVGGILVDAGYLSESKVESLLPQHIHSCEQDSKGREICLAALGTVKSEGARFVIFENKERISIINGDTTYLNIISEGLVRLFADLALEHPEQEISVDVTVALRKNVSAGRGIISTQEYRKRLEEKLLLAAHRENKKFCEYSLTFEDARTFRRLDFADIVCNTYLTKGRRKFTDVQKAQISRLFDSKYIYSVFETATVGYLKRLLSERSFGEMMLQICSLPSLIGVNTVMKMLLQRLTEIPTAEFDACMSYMSLQIGLCNNMGQFSNGIALANNYKKYFLSVLSENVRLHDKVEYWIFDTDFYILTMYDHIGDLEKCAEYVERCRARISSINHSWEHLEYYFRYRIRELNVLMGRFEFEKVISRADELIAILINAKELFSLIETFDNTASELKSELLGKVYGVKLEAYINLLNDAPELFADALKTSELAISEFSEKADLNRQYQYRCLLMTTAGKTEAAMECLMKIFEIAPNSEDKFKLYVETVFSNQKHPDEFALWHYLDVMLLAAKTDMNTAEEMAKVLFKNSTFAEYLQSMEKSGHPRQLVLWKIGKWNYLCGNINAGDSYYKAALDTALLDKDKTTMRSFAISIEADWVRQKWQKSIQFKHVKNLQSIQKHLDEMTDTMKFHFLGTSEKATEKDLQRLSKLYLK